LDVTGLPTPEWTEVVIGGQSNSMAVPIGGLPAMTGLPPMPTSVPGAVTSTPTPRVRLVGTIAANPNAVLTQAVSAIETVAPSPTRLPFGLLNSFTAAISERTAQWPIPWQWVLGILAVVVFVIVVIWLIRRRNRKD
jgi:hypothetical protein